MKEYVLEMITYKQATDRNYKDYHVEGRLIKAENLGDLREKISDIKCDDNVKSVINTRNPIPIYTTDNHNRKYQCGFAYTGRVEVKDQERYTLNVHVSVYEAMPLKTKEERNV